MNWNLLLYRKMPELLMSGPLLVFDFDCTIIHVDGDDEV